MMIAAQCPRRARLFGLAAALLVTLGVGPHGVGAVAAEAGTLVVQVANLRSGKGEIRFALWNNADGFTKNDKKLAGGKLPANSHQALVFENLPPGRYALAVYHDENGNGEFDRNWIGLPAEGLGFSNGAWINLGPPSFDDAAIEVGDKEEVITVSLRY
jgi:uncharacterized protein (DUF2141 family)